MNLDSELKRTCLVALLGIGSVSNAMGQDPFDDTDFAPPAASSAGQSTDDPFGAGFNANSRGSDLDMAGLGGEEFSNAGVGSPVVAPSSEKNAVVRSLLANPPQTPGELARAVQLMARIKRWDEVSRWLVAAKGLGITEESAAKMVDVAGVDVFQSLQSPLVDLPTEQKAIANSIVQLANLHRQNPNAIATAAARLQSSDPRTMRESFRLLQSSGYQGIEKFFDSVMAAQAVAPTRVMSEALRKLGPSARDAWLAAIKTPHSDAKTNLLLLAAGANDPAYTLDLLSFFSDQENLPSNLRTFASDWLASKKVSATASSELLGQIGEASETQLVQWLRAFHRFKFDQDEATEIRWELDPSGRKLAAIPCRPSQLLWERAVVEAANVARMDNAQKRDHALATAVLLQNADGSNSEAVVLAFGDISTKELERYEFACMVYDAAVKFDLPTAQARILQTLGRFSLPMPLEVRERLVHGLDSGYRPVRYVAASALMQSIQKGREQGVSNGSFQGRGRLDRVVLEMTQIRPNRQAVIVGGSASLRTHTRSLLEQFGYTCEEFSNARTLIARCKEGAPIDEIYVVHRVLEMEFGELVQRIRGTASGGKAPIAMLAESLSSQELRILADDQRVKLGSVPAHLDGLESVIFSMRLMGQGMELAEEARVLWRDEAQDFLASLKPATVIPTRAALVASVPQSPLGQKELVLKVTDGSLALPEREQASQLFVQSVRQFGLQISSETADGLYDVYNDRAKSDLEIRSTLGRILDAIEANRGERDWESVRP